MSGDVVPAMKVIVSGHTRAVRLAAAVALLVGSSVATAQARTQPPLKIASHWARVPGDQALTSARYAFLQDGGHSGTVLDDQTGRRRTLRFPHGCQANVVGGRGCLSTAGRSRQRRGCCAT
jgi:hypothetical protein